MTTHFRRFAVCLVGLSIVGCKTTAPDVTTASNPAFTPLPSIEREVLPDGSEIVVAPPADAEPAAAPEPRTWSEKFAAFCNPKPPKKSNSNRVYENDTIPYTD